MTKSHSASVHRVVIIGGGFSGAVAAEALINSTASPLQIHVIEPRPQLGAGVAYSTPEIRHLLNGPAEMINFGANDSLPFKAWLDAYVQAHELDVTAWQDGPRTFAPRPIFGRYISDRLTQAIARAGSRLKFEHLARSATDVQFEGGRARVYLEDGTQIEADHVLLATGAPPAKFPFVSEAAQENENYLSDPWRFDRYPRWENAEQVVMIGTGLTMHDALVSLDRTGFKGNVLAISRHGLSVVASRPAEAWPDVLDANGLPLTARSLLRALQIARKKISASGANWQSLPAALREATPLIWDRASERERRLYLRHLRAFWEVTRHRACPPAAKLVEAWLAESRLTVKAGHVQALEATADHALTLKVRFRGETEASLLRPEAVISCVGLEYNAKRLAAYNPLYKSLLARGIIRSGPVSFGIDATKNGAVIGVSGEPHPQLTAIGPVLRGVHWESNSINEILAQIPDVVGRLSPLVSQAHAAA